MHLVSLKLLNFSVNSDNVQSTRSIENIRDKSFSHILYTSHLDSQRYKIKENY